MAEDGRLAGRVALVTGAAHGERAALGADFAKTLAAAGAKVAAADTRDTASLVDEITAAGGEAILGPMESPASRPGLRLAIRSASATSG
jgi:NAD(P)-dependent dehydrogenase (short-subunit alcohol dehydrogenase family)